MPAQSIVTVVVNSSGQPPTPPPPPPPGGYVVSYEIANDWGQGATVNVTIKNNSPAQVNGWTLEWNFPVIKRFPTYGAVNTTKAVLPYRSESLLEFHDPGKWRDGEIRV